MLHQLRWRLGGQGFTLEQEGEFWVVSNCGCPKRQVRHEFKTLEDVETWLRMLEGK